MTTYEWTRKTQPDDTGNRTAALKVIASIVNHRIDERDMAVRFELAENSDKLIVTAPEPRCNAGSSIDCNPFDENRLLIIWVIFSPGGERESVACLRLGQSVRHLRRENGLVEELEEIHFKRRSS